MGKRITESIFVYDIWVTLKKKTHFYESNAWFKVLSFIRLEDHNLIKSNALHFSLRLRHMKRLVSEDKKTFIKDIFVLHFALFPAVQKTTE